MGKVLREELSFKTIKFEDKMDNFCTFYELEKLRKNLVKLGGKLKIILDDCCTFCELESEPEP